MRVVKLISIWNSLFYCYQSEEQNELNVHSVIDIYRHSYIHFSTYYIAIHVTMHKFYVQVLIVNNLFSCQNPIEMWLHSYAYFI